MSASALFCLSVTMCPCGNCYDVSVWQLLRCVNVAIVTMCTCGNSYGVLMWQLLRCVNVTIVTRC